MIQKRYWLRGGLWVLGIALVLGWGLMFLDQMFFGGATTFIDYIYNFVLFSWLVDMFANTEGGYIIGAFFATILSPVVWFILGVVVGGLYGKIKK